MKETNRGQRSERPVRRVYSGVIWIIFYAAAFASCSTAKSCGGGCAGCISGVIYDAKIAAIKKAIGCDRFCNIKVQFVDGSTGAPLTGVQSSSVEFDLVNGSRTMFSGTRAVGSDGTFTFPVDPCIDERFDGRSLEFLPYDITLKASNGCPAGQCRLFTVDPTASYSVGEIASPCTPVIRVPVKSRRSCVEC